MITPLNFPIYKQRDPRWSAQRLGTVNGTTIGQYGCLITTLAMANCGLGGGDLSPARLDDMFTSSGGYANGNLVIWSKIQAILPHVAHVGFDSCMNVAAPISKIKAHLDNGGLVALQVGFGGVAANMHWLLGDGYNGDNIIKCDPWYGDETDFTSKGTNGHFRYGTGDASRDILGVHYFAQGVAPVAPAPVADPPAKPIAKLAMENPVPYEEPTPEPVTVLAPEPQPIQTPNVLTWNSYPVATSRTSTSATNAVHLPEMTIIAAIPSGRTDVFASETTYNGETFYRTQRSTEAGSDIGVPAAAYNTGQVNGPIPVTVVSNGDLSDEDFAAATVPETPPVTFKMWLHDFWGRLISALIKKGTS